MISTVAKIPPVSIIIPLHWVVKPDNSKRFIEDLRKYLVLDYKKYEILVVVDKDTTLPFKDKKLRILVTGSEMSTSPAEKRDFAFKSSKGQILAFIDDDAYPRSDWLRKAIVHFSHPEIAAVGGPGITPKEDAYWQQITGLVHESILGGGFFRHRFMPRSLTFVKDYPAYNLLIRKDVLRNVGGWGSSFYGGEDTLVCLKIIKKGWKIIYDPNVVVFHHRRAVFIPFLKQIKNVGIHRGFFVNNYPETSRTFHYFIPSLFLISSLIGLVLSFADNKIRIIYLFLLIIFVISGMLSVVRKTSIKSALWVSLGIILMHWIYGFAFIIGYSKKTLAR